MLPLPAQSNAFYPNFPLWFWEEPPSPSHLLVRACFWEAPPPPPPPPPPSWFSEPAPPPPWWRQPTPHTITSIVAVCVCVCEEPRHLITRRVRGKESGSRFAICLPGTWLSHPGALPPSFHAHRSHTHATHNHNKHTAIWKEVLAFTPLEQKITIIYLIHFSCLLYDH